VVVGYDGSDFAMQALDWGVDEAKLRGLPLTVCHAWQWPYDEADEDSRNSLRHAAEHVVWHGADCARSSTSGIEVRSDLYNGSAGERLVQLSHEADLLVVGSRGLGGVARRVVGSVTGYVATHAHCPLIVVRGRGALPRRTRPGPVVAGVADREEADAAVLELSCQEAKTRQLTLMAVHAWSPPLVIREAAKQRLEQTVGPWRERYPDLTIETRVTEEPARQALLHASTDATLLVVGAPHGRFGSVTSAVLHNARCPVGIARS